MSEFPADILKAATAAAVDLPFDICGDEIRAVEEAFAKVILAEREKSEKKSMRKNVDIRST